MANRIVKVQETVDDLAYNLQKITFIKDKYPNLKLKKCGDEWEFFDKSVNRNFNKFTFEECGYGFNEDVRFKVYDEWDFEFNGAKEKLIVESIPTSCRFISLIADKHYDGNNYIPPEKRKYRIVISKPIFKSKDKETQKYIYNECIMRVLEFVKKHSYATVSREKLDPRIEKLIIFS